jgi:hypothetical protein
MRKHVLFLAREGEMCFVTASPPEMAWMVGGPWRVKDPHMFSVVKPG